MNVACEHRLALAAAFVVAVAAFLVLRVVELIVFVLDMEVAESVQPSMAHSQAEELVWRAVWVFQHI
jgi:hypothetical protein